MIIQYTYFSHFLCILTICSGYKQSQNTVSDFPSLLLGSKVFQCERLSIEEPDIGPYYNIVNQSGNTFYDPLLRPYDI